MTAKSDEIFKVPLKPMRAVTKRWPIAWVVMALLVCACAPEQRSYGEFRPLPAGEGWRRNMPLVFEPQFADSDATYDVTVGIRHTNDYAYRNVSLLVDLMDSAASVRHRKMVNLQVADEYGNWLGTGFGALFQCQTTVATAVSPSEAHRVVVWQVMDDTAAVNNVTDVGILIHKTAIQ